MAQADDDAETILLSVTGSSRHAPRYRAIKNPGIAALGDAAVNSIVNAIASFHDFNADNDPWGEHDFGTLQFEGHSVVFKIDYYALDGESHSPDPSDPGVTERVITIMLAEEY